MKTNLFGALLITLGLAIFALAQVKTDVPPVVTGEPQCHHCLGLDAETCFRRSGTCSYRAPLKPKSLARHFCARKWLTPRTTRAAHPHPHGPPAAGCAERVM